MAGNKNAKVFSIKQGKRKSTSPSFFGGPEAEEGIGKQANKGERAGFRKHPFGMYRGSDLISITASKTHSHTVTPAFIYLVSPSFFLFWFFALRLGRYA